MGLVPGGACPGAAASRSRRRGLLRARDGVAALEFGMIGVVLCFLLIFCLELFWQVYASVQLDYGVREATRFSITGAASSAGSGSPSCRSGTIVWLVTYTTALSPSQLSVSSSNYTGGSSTLASGTTGGAAGQTQTYLFTYRQYFFTPLATALYGQAYIDHKAVAIIKNEAYVATPC